MQEILIKGADVVVTMNGARREIAGGDVLLRGGVIADVGQGLSTAGEVIHARGCVVTPGLVNTHHHLYQTLTRAVPAGQDALLFGWLKTLYPIWARFGPEEMFVSAQVGLAELALSTAVLVAVSPGERLRAFFNALFVTLFKGETAPPPIEQLGNLLLQYRIAIVNGAPQLVK